VAVASWWFAGFLTIADWIGSRREWFDYIAPRVDDEDLSGYWGIARERARIAVGEAGLASVPPASLVTFAQLTGKLSPTPTQQWAASVPLPDGPVLAIIEDTTGSGKTEAAQMLVHRLMVADRASGAYWAMPTQSTANAMYERQRAAISALFSPINGVLPSLTLGHGQARMHAGYRSTILEDVAVASSDEELVADGESGDPASVACAAFLADDRRAALLADIGVGTVDQALLGVLPSRFSAVRLFALSEKVLVLDEVHAFDAYMSTEVKQLLRFHSALGGSAVLLSATLPEKKRRELEIAWRADDPDIELPPPQPGDSPYPMTTLAVNGGAASTYAAHASEPRSIRRLPVRMIHTEEDGVLHVVRVANAGGAVVWIRNTVDECVRTAALLATHGFGPIVFHARFPQGDRQRIEAEVTRRFGLGSTESMRRGSVLVATQVVEQSLDLDFDAMVSDLAPIDLLIQRAGRLWRHQRSDRPLDVCELLVLAPHADVDVSKEWPNELLRNSGYVYPDPGVLWRTAVALGREQVLDAPHGLRALIREVYEGHTVPPALTRRESTAQGNELSDAGVADYTVVGLGRYVVGRHWTDDLRAPTRLGDEQVALRLARVEGNQLQPWHRDPDLPEWHRWLLSEVKVSRRRVSSDATPVGPWKADIERLRSTWGRFEQHTPVVVMEPDVTGDWSGVVESAKRKGQELRLRCSEVLGVSFF